MYLKKLVPDTRETGCFDYVHCYSNMIYSHGARGAIRSLFECTNDFNEHLIADDYVSDFKDFKSLWHHRLHIVLSDFSKLHIIQIIFI